MGLISRVSSRTYRKSIKKPKSTKKHQKMALAHQFVTGKNKGHKVNKLAGHKNDQSRKRGAVTKSTNHVRKVIREVVGYAGYEKRCIELLKFSKKRLGTHTAAKRKREEMQAHIQEEKRAA